MKYLLTGIAAVATICGSTSADLITTSFENFKTNPVQIGDKLFTYRAGGLNFGNANAKFESDMVPGLYSFEINFDNPGAIAADVIDFEYSIQVTDPLVHITGLEVHVQQRALGSDFNLNKNFFMSPAHVTPVSQLVNVNGRSDFDVGRFGQLLYVHVSATLPAGAEIDSFRDGYTQHPLVDIAGPAAVPEPGTLALAGLGAFGLIAMTWLRLGRSTRKTTLASRGGSYSQRSQTAGSVSEAAP